MERMIQINAAFDEVCQQVGEVFVNQLYEHEDRANNILLIGDHNIKPREMQKSMSRDKSLTTLHKKSKTTKNSKNLEIKIDFQDIVQSTTIDETNQQNMDKMMPPSVPNRPKSNRSIHKAGTRPNSRSYNKSSFANLQKSPKDSNQVSQKVIKPTRDPKKLSEQLYQEHQ